MTDEDVPETTPVGPEPGVDDAEPVETEPVETEPVDAEPVETEPVDAEPVETELADAAPRASPLPKALAIAASVAAVGGAVAGSLPVALPTLASVGILSLGLVLLLAAAWALGRGAGAASRAEEETRYRRELLLNGYSLLLLVVFLLLALTELLAIPAALGRLVVFSKFGLAFVQFYPALIGALTLALAGAVLLAAGRGGLRSLEDRERAWGIVSLVATVLLLATSLAMGAGALESLGLKSERSVFMLAGALVTAFFYVKAWSRLPAYSEVSEWLEREERVRDGSLIRRIAYGLLGLAGVGVLVTLIVTAGLGPRPVGLLGAGLGMLALLGATFNVGVSHVVPALEMGLDNAQDVRRKRRIVLAATSLGLTLLSLAVGALTVFALLAQVAGLDVFRFLLEFYVAFYPLIFGLVLVPLIAAVYVRTRVQTEVKYSDKLKALAVGTSTVTIVLLFFGVFIGSGLAEGSGLQIQNAVLVMGAAVLTLIQFVKARTLLPGIAHIVQDSIKEAESADVDTKQRIHNQMIATYVLALVFVLGFVGFVAATTFGVVPKPAESLGTDVGLFVYLLAGIALLVFVVLRYVQQVNVEGRWATKKQEDIGKKRLTADEVKKYLILGFSIGMAALLFIVGLLVMFQVVTSLGPLPLAKKYATDFFVFAILIGLGPYGWYSAREARRVEAIDQKFPEFLRDLAESQRSGMTLTEAVATAAKGNYGLLTGEIRKMAAQIEWGISFSDALTRFSKRVETPLIKRTVALIIQASSAGGNVVDVLTAAADDAREIQQIVKERKQSMSIYVMIIYIAFAVFVGVIAVLNAQFIPEVAKAVEKADGVSIGGLNFRKFDQEDFKTLFFHAAIIQGMGGGIVGGVMAGGKPIFGLRHSFILVTAAWVLFRLIIG